MARHYPAQLLASPDLVEGARRSDWVVSHFNVSDLASSNY